MFRFIKLYHSYGTNNHETVNVTQVDMAIGKRNHSELNIILQIDQVTARLNLCKK